jgi:APA family basic amino acid/polyamine antiporter
MKTTKNQLKKALSLSFGIAIMVGSTIGVGILRTPSLVAGLLDNSWLIIACWLIGGTYILIGAGTFIELATMLPKAGGAFNYVERAFGKKKGLSRVGLTIFQMPLHQHFFAL